MSHYNTIFNQLLAIVPRHHFDKLTAGLDSNRYVKTFTSWHQFITLLYAQACGKQSLRDIQNGLEAHGDRLYHLGLPVGVKRPTLSDANMNRPCVLFENLFYAMVDRCKDITPEHKFRFKNRPVRLGFEREPFVNGKIALLKRHFTDGGFPLCPIITQSCISC